MPCFMTLKDASQRWAFDTTDDFESRLLKYINTGVNLSMKTVLSSGPGLHLLQQCLNFSLSPSDFINGIISIESDEKLKKGLEYTQEVIAYGLVKDPREENDRRPLSEGAGFVMELGFKAIMIVVAHANPLTVVPGLLFGVVMYLHNAEKKKQAAWDKDLMKSMVDNWNSILAKNMEKKDKQQYLESTACNPRFQYDEAHQDSGWPGAVWTSTKGTKIIVSRSVIRDLQYALKKKGVHKSTYTALHYGRLFYEMPKSSRAILDGSWKVEDKVVDVKKLEIYMDKPLNETAAVDGLEKPVTGGAVAKAVELGRFKAVDKKTLDLVEKEKRPRILFTPASESDKQVEDDFDCGDEGMGVAQLPVSAAQKFMK